MKKIIRLSLPALLMPMVIIGSWVGGDCLAGDIIPISQVNKIYLMSGLTVGNAILFFVILIKVFRYRYKELIPVVIIGVVLLVGLTVTLINMMLHNFN